jgi:hypothetical protein
MTVDLAAPRVGDAIPGTRKTIYQRALDETQFSADSIHSNDYTRTKGYPGALVSAYVLNGYMSEMMVNLFGWSWFSSGRISLTFIGKGVQQGDQVVCGGQVKAVEDGPDGRRIILEIWMDKADGARPVIGEASAIWAPQPAAS